MGSFQRRVMAFFGIAATVATLMITMAISTGTASADHGLDPSGSVQNIPDSGSCGDNGGRWVKFTTGGPVSTVGTANSGQPDWTAQYVADAGHITIFGVLDENGNALQFDAVAGGAGRDNPVWTFAPTFDSGVLNVDNTRNFSQFAICALPLCVPTNYVPCPIAPLPGDGGRDAGAGAVQGNSNGQANGPAPAVSSSSLPNTGSDTLPMAQTGLIAIAAGGMLVLFARRR